MTRPHPTLTIATLALLLGGAALAKLPPLSDEAKAKAAEAAAKTAWGDKLAGFQLCKSQDRAAANFQNRAKEAGKEAKLPTTTPACTDPGPYVVASAASGVKPLEAASAHSPTTTFGVQGQPKK